MKLGLLVSANKRPSKTYAFMRLGARDVTKPYTCIWFGDICGPRPYQIHTVSMGVYVAVAIGILFEYPERFLVIGIT